MKQFEINSHSLEFSFPCFICKSKFSTAEQCKECQWYSAQDSDRYDLKLEINRIANKAIETMSRNQTGGNTMTELLPCPFCGNTDLEIEDTSSGCQIVCYKCGIGHVECNWTAEYCLKSWNTRKDGTPA